MRIHPPTTETPNQEEPAQILEIDIFRSSVDRTKLLSVPVGVDVKDIQFPSDLDEDLHSVRPYKNAVRIERGKPALGLDVEDIFRQISARGFAAHLLKTTSSIDMSVRLGGAPT